MAQESEWSFWDESGEHLCQPLAMAYCWELRRELERESGSGLWYCPIEAWRKHKHELWRLIDNWQDSGKAPAYDSALRNLILATLDLDPPPWLATLMEEEEAALLTAAALNQSPMPATPAQPTEQ